MSELRLLLASLRYHWPANAAILGAVIAGTAVIGGALVVGDSVRGSLREMSLARLGRIDHALSSGRFFREEAAAELVGQSEFDSRFRAAAPALVVQGIFVAEHDRVARRAGRVQVYGVDVRMWELIDHADRAAPKEQEVDLNERLAQQLGVGAGANVSLWVQPPSNIPRESLLGKRDSEFLEVPLKVRSVLKASEGAARLSLNPTQQLPLNAFVPLVTLQQSLGLAHAERSRRNPDATPARVNSLFVAAREPADQLGSTAVEAARTLDQDLGAILTPADLGLRIIPSPRGYLSLESDQQILEDGFSEAGMQTAKRLGMQTSPVLAYLANEIINAAKPAKYSRYSVVAGFDPVSAKTPPFGPFTWSSPPPDHPLADDEIVLNDWLASDLDVKAHDVVRMRYHLVGAFGDIPEEERTFRVAGIVKLDGTPAADPNLVPIVKGMTDAKTFSDWKKPFPMKLNVTPRDEAYWDKYRATPKSFVSLEIAKKLWANRFGSLTSVRAAVPEGKSADRAADDWRRDILKSLGPSQTRLAFEPVKYIGVRAAAGSNDFSQLFLGFSFFLILAAAILVGLVFRLGIERRGTAIGLLSAVGFTPRRLRRLFLLEGLTIVFVGGLIGAFVAVGYAHLMVFGLKMWWNQAIGTQSLAVFVVPSSLAIGFGASAGVALVAVIWGLRQLRRLSTRELLQGMTEPQRIVFGDRRRGARILRIGAILAAIAVVTALAGVSGVLPSGEAFEGLTWNVVLFFVDGLLLLTAGVLIVAGLLSVGRFAVYGRGVSGIGRLGLRNTGRHRQRSVASVSMIAVATFVIVAVAAGRRNPARETPELNSGNGGFRLVAESTDPILFDINTPAGRDKLDLHVTAGSPEAALLEGSRAYAFRVKPGEDASCLNVYQTKLPTILGVPQSFIERGGFRFIGASEDNPWKVLDRQEPNGNIPAIGDANTLQFSLHKATGETISTSDDGRPNRALKIAGMLDGSVFQGVLLVSEGNFRRLFPDVTGYGYFLVEVPGSAADGDRLAGLLETQLSKYGFDAERVSQRLAAFLAVQNTYLSTFQTLGGFGLLLGTLGLGTVMVRNVLERRAELALLNALGFKRAALAGLVLVETAVLLFCGLATGTLAAFVAMAPHLLTTGADLPRGSLALTLTAVFVVGMLAALVAAVQAAKTPIVEGLRAE